MMWPLHSDFFRVNFFSDRDNYRIRKQTLSYLICEIKKLLREFNFMQQLFSMPNFLLMNG